MKQSRGFDFTCRFHFALAETGRARAHLRRDGGPLQPPAGDLGLEAVNRRGRAITVRVARTPLRRRDGGPGEGAGAIVVMETA
ncbi:hypothetical protein ACTI_79470 [Actinoplanes sp. OR16]|nr:hypothetical protein ACTI_79470 [Actinoplanes sp. OR16]